MKKEKIEIEYDHKDKPYEKNWGRFKIDIRLKTRPLAKVQLSDGLIQELEPIEWKLSAPDLKTANRKFEIQFVAAKFPYDGVKVVGDTATTGPLKAGMKLPIVDGKPSPLSVTYTIVVEGTWDLPGQPPFKLQLDPDIVIDDDNSLTAIRQGLRERLLDALSALDAFEEAAPAGDDCSDVTTEESKDETAE